MYAENWVYAPAIQKAKRLIRASGSTIFELRGEESHHGSHMGGERLGGCGELGDGDPDLQRRVEGDHLRL